MSRSCWPQFWRIFGFIWKSRKSNDQQSSEVANQDEPPEDPVPPRRDTNGHPITGHPPPFVAIGKQKTPGPTKLHNELVAARIEWPKGENRYFVPQSSLRSLITEDVILEEFKSCAISFQSDGVRDQTARDILEKALHLFAILVYIRMTETICDFLRDGIQDDQLPFVRHEEGIPHSGKYKLCSIHNPNEPLACMETWDFSGVEDFAVKQWCMLAPIFKGHGKNELPNHYDLDDNCILPLIVDEERNETPIQGGFSTVWEVVIHDAHHNLWTSTIPGVANPSIAVKRLHSTKEEEFKSEVEMLQHFSKSTHRHLIKLLATYRLKGRYYLLFPYAKSNLRKYWENTPLPNFSTDTVWWCLRQCKAIASALHRIHDFTSTKLDDTIVLQREHTGAHLYGRHGDIKPENILWSNERIEDKEGHVSNEGLLLIADFGLMDFHTGFSRSLQVAEGIHGSPTYAPPERRLHGKLSRAYDVWGLGCVYLEFITWLVCGWEDLKLFSPVRAETGPVRGMAWFNQISDDTFFSLVEDGDGKPPRGIVRPSVQEWMGELHEKPRCSMFVNDFLNLISERMLVVEPKDRITCALLNKELRHIMEKAKRNPEYLTAPRATSPQAQRQDPLGSTSRTTQAPFPYEGSSLPTTPSPTVDAEVTSLQSPEIRPQNSPFLPNVSPI